jgi:hypothetical protein
MDTTATLSGDPVEEVGISGVADEEQQPATSQAGEDVENESSEQSDGVAVELATPEEVVEILGVSLDELALVMEYGDSFHRYSVPGVFR